MVLRKLLALLPTVLLVSFLTYVLIDLLPGDAATLMAPPDAPAETIEAIREDLNLDDPLLVRYVKWLGDVLQGDFGRSYRTNQPVLEAITERLPVTLQIGLMALVFALVLAIPLGVISAYKANTAIDKSITTVSFGLLAIPNFVMALMLVFLFAIPPRDFLPSVGWVKLSEDVAANLQRAILPALALSIGQLAVYTRLLRTDMIATLQEDFVSMARAKGLPTWRILMTHALRPSSFSLLTIVGLQVGALIGGTVIVEQFFALPGIGRLLFESIGNRDLVVVQGLVLFIGLTTVFANFAVDLIYSVLDPRIRRGATSAA